jgi:5-methylcytosine-specific restriction endonuclease McrA
MTSIGQALRALIVAGLFAFIPAYRIEARAWWDDYRRYMRSRHWQRRRRLIIWRDLERCRACGARGWHPRESGDHHTTYIRAGRERPADLMLLCGRCHIETSNNRGKE